jgi:hypothetical protein
VAECMPAFFNFFFNYFISISIYKTGLILNRSFEKEKTLKRRRKKEKE